MKYRAEVKSENKIYEMEIPRLGRAAFHLLNPVAGLLDRLFDERRRRLYVAELAFFLSHFLTRLAYRAQVLLAVFYSLFVGGAGFNNDIKVHYLAIFLCYIRVIDCAFHTRDSSEAIFNPNGDSSSGKRQQNVAPSLGVWLAKDTVEQKRGSRASRSFIRWLGVSVTCKGV